MESTPLPGDHPAILQFLLNISFDNACKGLEIVPISHLGEGFDLSRGRILPLIIKHDTCQASQAPQESPECQVSKASQACKAYKVTKAKRGRKAWKHEEK